MYIYIYLCSAKMPKKIWSVGRRNFYLFFYFFSRKEQGRPVILWKYRYFLRVGALLFFILHFLPIKNSGCSKQGRSGQWKHSFFFFCFFFFFFFAFFFFFFLLFFFFFFFFTPHWWHIAKPANLELEARFPSVITTCHRSGLTDCILRIENIEWLVFFTFFVSVFFFFFFFFNLLVSKEDF